MLHHIVARGLDRQRIFRDNRDRDDFLRRVENLADSEAWELSAWALIPNHFHLHIERLAKEGAVKIVVPNTDVRIKAIEIARTGHKKNGYPEFTDCLYHSLAILNNAVFISRKATTYYLGEKP